METITDWLREVLGWIVAAVGSWATYVTVRLHKQAERLSVLEKAVTDIAAKLPEEVKGLSDRLAEDMNDLKGSVGDMRHEGRVGREKLYERIEDIRLELKADINRESDKRAN